MMHCEPLRITMNMIDAQKPISYASLGKTEVGVRRLKHVSLLFLLCVRFSENVEF